MSKSMTKHRNPGGSHTGGQPQSNQRQTDFSRGNNPSERFQHGVRQGNQAGLHIPANSIPQINTHMHSQQQTPAQSAISTPQVLPNPLNRFNSPHLQANMQPMPISQPMQQIHLGSAQTPVLQNHIINQNPTPRPAIVAHQYPRVGGVRPSYNNMPAFRPGTNNVAPTPTHGIPQIHHHGSYYPGYYPTSQNYTTWPNMFPVGYSSVAPVSQQNFYDGATFVQQRYPYHQPMNYQQNMQGEMMGQQNAYRSENPKKPEQRKKTILEFLDDSGQPLDLHSIAKESKEKPVPIQPEVESKTTTDKTESSDISVNGTSLDLKAPASCEIVQSPGEECPVTEQVTAAEPEGEPTEAVPALEQQAESEVPSETVASSSEEVPCDSDQVSQSNHDSAENKVETATLEKHEHQPAIDSICEKLDNIVLESTSTSTASEVALEVAEEKNEPLIATNENQAPLHDTSKPTETSIFRDMEVKPSAAIATEDELPKKIIEGKIDPQESSSAAVSPGERVDESPKQSAGLSKSSSQVPTNESQPQNDLVYNKDFLLSLRDHASSSAISNSNQDNIRDIIRKNTPTNSSDFLLPTYAKNRSQNDSYRNKSQGSAFRRPSQPSKNYSDSRSRKSNTPHALHMEYQPSENAWRPGKVLSSDPAEIETESLLKNVRSVLNKLTPQNYQTLLEQFKKLKIDTRDRLTRVIDLIFDKAVREPAFIVQYAGFCAELGMINVLEENENGEKVQVKFKNLLVEKCQLTFFQEMYYDIKDMEERTKEVEECTDPVKKKELEELLDDDKRLSRKRSVGNIMLIAELYKLKILNAKIMFACFTYLLKHQQEEFVECLCALITNIGKQLTLQMSNPKFSNLQPQFDSIFKQLESLQKGEDEFKVSSRIRFMILDLIDLRKNDWVPRRKKEGPKTIAQVHEDMENEKRMKNESMNEKINRRNRGGGGGGGGHGARDSREPDEWQQVNKRKSHSGAAPTQKINLASLNILKDLSTSGNNSNKPTGNALSQFAFGSHGGSSSNSHSRSSSSTYETKFHPLINDNKSQRTFHDSLSAKDQHSRRDERKVSDVTNYHVESRNDSSGNRRPTDYRLKSNIDIEDLKFLEKTKTCFNEYLEHSNYGKTVEQIVTFCSVKTLSKFIAQSIFDSIEKTSHSEISPREKWGQFIGQFFLSNICENTDIFEGLKQLYIMYDDDMRIDFPRFFPFVGELLAHVLITVWESQGPKQKEVVKAISNSIREVTGNDLQELKDCVIKTVKIHEPSLAQDKIQSLFSQSNSNEKSNIENVNQLDQIINQYLEKKDLSRFKSDLEANFSNYLEDNEFKSAFYKKLFENLFKTSNKNDVSGEYCIERIEQVLTDYVRSEDDQFQLLVAVSLFAAALNNPPNMFVTLLSNLVDAKIVSRSAILKLQNYKKVPTVVLASAHRFFQKFSGK